MRRALLFIIIVGGILASCIGISPTPEVQVFNFGQRKCVAFYETFIIKNCNYADNKKLCYHNALVSMRDLIYKNCGVDITD